jgi:hypothetical protein
MRKLHFAFIPLLAAGVPLVAAGFSAGRVTAAPPLAVTVYKTPQCGCCRAWVDHLREHGFEVSTHDVDDISAIKTKLGVPSDLTSCHTAVAGSYVVEGHVPADDIRKLLETKPKVAGVAVRGMPVGSPGMEVPGRKADKYDVVAYTKAGKKTVFAAH